MLTEAARKIIQALQCDLPVEAQPFRRLAAQLGLDEELLLATVRELMAQGYIRRFGATIRHRISGFSANAMVAWAVPPRELDRVGPLFASRREVTHCYERETNPAWPYNLFTMIHGKTQEECEAVAADMAGEAGVSDFEMLYSDAELKKTTMRYFMELDADEGESSRE